MTASLNKKLILIPLLALGLILAPLGEVFATSCATCMVAPSHTVDKDLVERGEVLTYTIRVENIGADVIDPVFVAETLSPYVSFISGSTRAYKGSKSVDVVDAWLTDGLNLGTLDPGQVTVVEFQTQVREDAPDGAFIESVAQIKKTWLGGDANEWIQCAAQSTLVGSLDQPYYSPEKTVDKATAHPGEILTYTLTVENTGNVALHSVFVADTLPPFVTYVSGSAVATKGSKVASITDAWLTDGLNLGELAVGHKVTVVFQVKVDADAPDGQLLENVAHFKTEEFPKWVQCAARTTVVVGEILKAENIPQVLAATGPEDLIATGILLGYLGFLLRRLKLTKYF